MTIYEDPSFVRSMTILPNNTGNQKYTILPPIITNPSYCKVIDIVLIDLEVRTNFWDPATKKQVAEVYTETEGIVLAPKITAI